MNAHGITISTGLIKLMEAGRASVTDRTIEKYMTFFRCSRGYITGEEMDELKPWEGVTG